MDEKYKELIFKNQRGRKSFLIPYKPEMKNERIIARPAYNIMRAL